MSNPELPLDAAQLRASSLAGGTQEMLFSDDLTALGTRRHDVDDVSAPAVPDDDGWLVGRPAVSPLPQRVDDTP